MTKLELIQLLVGQARVNGFEFRRWYVSTLNLPWTSTAEATATLAEQRRYYVLLFSHEFARHFWKAGERITFLVPTQTFLRRRADGTIGSVTRKAYTRRKRARGCLALPPARACRRRRALRYMRRYLRILDDLEEDPLPLLPPE